MFYVYKHRQSGQLFMFTQKRHEFYVENLGKMLDKRYEVQAFETKQEAEKASGRSMPS